MSESGEGKAPLNEEPYKVPTDEELVKDYSVLKTCVSEEVARDALGVLNKAIETSKLSLADRDLSDEAFMRVVKAIGIFAKLKNMLPTRTSVLPVTEVDLSGNSLMTFTPHAVLGTPEVSQRSLQPLQLTVQFVRVSTDAKVIRLENCNLQGTSHDKDDKIEQEVIRLVKKFGAGKEARYAQEVSLAGNKFEGEFAKKIIEAAYWERVRHPDKDNPPKLHLDLRKNRIRTPQKLVEELRAGQNAGGAILVAGAEEPSDVREKALIVVDLADQVDRSVTPVRGQRITAVERPRVERQMRPPTPVPRRSPTPASRAPSPPRPSRQGRSISRSASKKPGCGRGRRHRAGSGCGRLHNSRSRSRRRGRRRRASCSSDSRNSCSPSPAPRAHAGGRRRRRRRRRPRAKSPSDSRVSNSRSPSPRRGSRGGGGGGKRRRRR